MPSAAGSCGSVPVGRLVLQQHAFALGRREQDDARGFERAADLVARRLVHVEAALGLEALESGKRYPGLVSERLLSPVQQRARPAIGGR